MSKDNGKPKKTIRANEEFWDNYDSFWEARGYDNRSEAVRDDLGALMQDSDGFDSYRNHFMEVRSLCYEHNYEDAINYIREKYGEDEPERAWLEEYIELFREN